jgi:uncharacterized protein YraI
MKFKIFSLLCVLGLSFSSFAQNAYTKTNLNLRRGPSTDFGIIQVVPISAELAVLTCNGDWCNVEYKGISGYVNKKYIIKSDPNYDSNSNTVEGFNTLNISTPSTHARALENLTYYTNSHGNRVQSPTSYDAIPVGATAQCRDGAYSFSQSRRGTCSRHGGVSRWLN